MCEVLEKLIVRRHQGVCFNKGAELGTMQNEILI